MAEEKKIVKLPHNLILEDRKFLTVSGVLDMDNFDEQTVVVFTDMGELTVKGMNLHINKLNIDTGELTMEGDIQMLSYSDVQVKNNSGGLFSKLFR